MKFVEISKKKNMNFIVHFVSNGIKCSIFIVILIMMAKASKSLNEEEHIGTV